MFLSAMMDICRIEAHICNKPLLLTELFSPRAPEKLQEVLEVPDGWAENCGTHHLFCLPHGLQHPRRHSNPATLLPSLLFANNSQITLWAVCFSHGSSKIRQLGILNQNNSIQLCILPKSDSVLFNLSTNFQFFAASVITSLWGSFVIIHSQLYSGKMQQERPR